MQQGTAGCVTVRRRWMTFQSLTGLPVQVYTGKLTSLRDHELRDVSPTADAGLLKHHTVSYKRVPVKLVAHRRHWPRHGAAIFPRNAHQVGLYI